MEKEAIDLGHVGSGGIRADGLQNVLIGMGTGRDKSQYTKTTATVFLAQEELENLYGEWLPRRIVLRPLFSVINVGLPVDLL